MSHTPHPSVPGATQGGSTVLYHRQRDPQILLTKHPVTLPSGHRYDAHTLHTGGNTRSVAVIAKKATEILLVHSYRPSIGELIWELPRGFGEGNPNDPEQAVLDGRRELLEETGYEADTARYIGEFILDTTFYPSRMAVIECDVTESKPTSMPDGEVEAHAWFELTNLQTLKQSGVLRDGASLAALALYGL